MIYNEDLKKANNEAMANMLSSSELHNSALMMRLKDGQFQLDEANLQIAYYEQMVKGLNRSGVLTKTYEDRNTETEFEARCREAGL